MNEIEKRYLFEYIYRRILERIHESKQKPIWEIPYKRKKGKKKFRMTEKQKAEAKARAEKAGRKYPNLIDNLAVIRKYRKKKK